LIRCLEVASLVAETDVCVAHVMLVGTLILPLRNRPSSRQKLTVQMLRLVGHLADGRGPLSVLVVYHKS
jgi:hypothetical protein